MKDLVADLRFGLRMLMRTPLLSLAAVITVALGVGVTTHTFSFVYGTILRGLPVPAPDELVYIHRSVPSRDITSSSLAYPDALDLATSQSSFRDVATLYWGTVNLAGEEAAPERFEGAFVSANLLDLVGVRPLLGRTFRDGEDLHGAPARIVLAYHVWQNRFAADADVLGRTVRMNGAAAEIIGVMPEGFRFPFQHDVWVAHRLATDVPRNEAPFIETVARLRPGVTMPAAGLELDTFAAEQAERWPETNEGVQFGLAPFPDRYMPEEIRAVMWIMLVSVFGVLLVACFNVANLLLARATGRTREVAVRSALGASRWRVVRQLLAEAVVLAGLGGALGMIGAVWGVAAVNSWIADIEKPYWIAVNVDAPMLGFAVAITLAASVVAGVLPALRASGVGVGEILKDQGRGSSSLRMGRFSTALVVSEIAISTSLLIGAGLLVRSVINMRTLDLGFRTEDVMTGRVTLQSDYTTREARHAFFRELNERLRAEGGVLSASLASSLPGTRASSWVFQLEGESYATEGDYPVTFGTVVTPDFFDTFGVRPLQGRDFTATEAEWTDERVVIVNQSFAARYFPDGDPIGRRVRLGRAGSTSPSMRVVGVVPDLHVGGGVGGIGDDRQRSEQIYVPTGMLDMSSMSLAVRTQGPPEALAGRLRALVQEMDADLPLYDAASMATVLETNTWAFGLFGTLFSIFGAVALLLAAVGLYGVLAFSVSQRRKEVGVRMALGASGRAILGMVLRRGLTQLGIGLGIGLAAGAILARPLSVILFGVEPVDAVVYAAIVLTLGTAGLAACLIPARVATRTDPVEAIRIE